MDDSLRNKKILIIQQRSWAKRIGRFLARKLSEEGAILGVITLKRTTHRFITNQREISYAYIQSLDDLRENPQAYLLGDHYTLEEICTELGVDSIWPQVVALRNHTRTFSEKHFYSFRQNVSDEDIVLYIEAIFKMIKEVFAKFNPDIIITPNFVSLPHIMLNLYAKKKGVRTLATIDSKVRGMTLFTESFNADEGRFFDWLKELNHGGANSENLSRAREYIKDFRERFKIPTYFEYFINKQHKSLRERIISELMPYYLSLSWYVKGLIPGKRKRRDIDYAKNLGPTVDWRPPYYILREHYAVKWYTYRTNHFNYYPLDKIGKFVYFPLQYQPESTIDVMAPFFSNQIETARLVAMSLPEDYTLVVKDHPAMVGYRTPSYLEKLARTPNIKLIDYRVPTGDIIKRAGLIISPNSTTVAEAAFYHKPGIQLGNLGTTLMLPNMRKHTDMTTLSSAVLEALKSDLKTEEYERKLENYVAAVYDTGFSFDYMGVWQHGRKEDLMSLWEAYKEEILYTLKK
jgi:hypothetical protein